MNVWGGIVGDYAIGVHCFEEIVNRKFVWTFRLLIRLENVDIQAYDGAPTHHNALLHGQLDDQFPRWIGKGRPVHWPPKSSNLRIVHFSLW